ncbi:hypothetical protein DL96DRAFT_238122 [Flagelloscypha sp. PMI_526]|nr:hypothetical protein DL96DRAFT_238122 [Flagelloscypha sp. PMI_526]
MRSSMSLAELFAALPVELARYILQIGAHQHYPTAVSLSFVSKTVQSLVDPFLFQTIVLRRYPLLGFIASFSCPSLTSARLIQAREYVRCIFIQSPIPQEHLSQLLVCCPNITCLDIRLHVITLNDLSRITPPCLRRVYLRVLTSDRQGFSIPFFQNITHLTVWYPLAARSLDYIEALQHLLGQLHNLDNLTHFCTNSSTRDISQVRDLMSKDRLKDVEAFSKNLHVSLLSIEEWSPESDWSLVKAWESDSRLVLGVLFERCRDLDPIIRTRMQAALPDVIIPENGRWHARPLDIEMYWSKAESIVEERLERSF